MGESDHLRTPDYVTANMEESDCPRTPVNILIYGGKRLFSHSKCNNSVHIQICKFAYGGKRLSSHSKIKLRIYKIDIEGKRSSSHLKMSIYEM